VNIEETADDAARRFAKQVIELQNRVEELESERDEFRARLMRFEGSVDSARGDTAEMAEIAHGLEQQRDAAVAVLSAEVQRNERLNNLTTSVVVIQAALKALGAEEAK
jgi:predicted  nucleic acid-binding Zn-ribbon protein